MNARSLQRLHRHGGRLSPIAIIVVAVGLGVAGLSLVGEALYIHAKAAVAQVLLKRAFEIRLATGVPTKPWSWADTEPTAMLEVARLGVRSIVLSGHSGQALAFGPGHVAGTPEPGEPGTAVFAAHRDTHFAFAGDLGVGDVLRVTRADGRSVKFKVKGTRVVRWDRSGVIAGRLPGAMPRLVLATCWPLDSRLPGPMRYLIEAEAVGTGG